MDFSPMLHANPLLQNVTLNLDGICVSPDTAPAFLQLRSFTGSVKNCAAIAPLAKGLLHITMLIPVNSIHDIQRSVYYGPTPTFIPAVFARNTSLTVTSFDARAVDKWGSIGRYSEQLTPASVACLVAAFPNLTHLDLSLSSRMKDYRASFKELLGLQHLGVRVKEYVQVRNYNRPATELFPAANFATEINDWLAPLSQLSDVHIILCGKCTLPSTGCTSCDEDQEPPLDLLVEFRFGRELGEEAFKLFKRTASDGSRMEGIKEDQESFDRLYLTFGSGGFRRRRRVGPRWGCAAD